MVDLSHLHVSAFLLSIREGQVEEYRRRHAEIWPDMKEALRESGVIHYDIFLDPHARKAFGHILRDRRPDTAAPEHPVILQWRAFMADVLEMEGELPRRDPIEHVFHMTDRT